MMTTFRVMSSYYCIEFAAPDRVFNPFLPRWACAARPTTVRAENCLAYLQVEGEVGVSPNCVQTNCSTRRLRAEERVSGELFQFCEDPFHFMFGLFIGQGAVDHVIG